MSSAHITIMKIDDEEVAKMASDKRTLAESAMQKLEDFRRLRNPIRLLRGVCNFMGATTRRTVMDGH